MSWLQQASQVASARLRHMSSTAPEAAFDVDSAERRQWLDIGYEYTCVPPAAYPYDPEVLKAIQTILPGAAPLWVRWARLSPATHNSGRELVINGRHAIGIYDAYAPEWSRITVTAMPTVFPGGVKFDLPNRVLRGLWKKPKPGSDVSYGDYMPFDWWAYYWIYDDFAGTWDKADIRASMQTKRDKEARLRAQNAAEHDYKQRDIQAYANKQLEQVSEVDARDHVRRQAEFLRKIGVPVGDYPPKERQ